MKFDKTVTLSTTSKTQDGMGGWTTTPVYVGSIAAFTTPVKSEVLLKEYGIVSTSALKLFTKDLVPMRDGNGKKQTVTVTLEMAWRTRYSNMPTSGKFGWFWWRKSYEQIKNRGLWRME